MKLNPKLLNKIPPKLRDLTKILLTCIEEDIELNEYLTHHPNSSNLHWKEDILGKLQEVVIILEKNEIIELNEDRGDSKSRWKLKYAIRECEEIETSNSYVESCRYYFTKSYCGASARTPTAKRLKPFIDSFLAEYPDYKEVLPDVLKYRVDQATEPKYIPKLLHFLNIEKSELWIDKDVHVYKEEWENLTNEEKNSTQRGESEWL